MEHDSKSLMDILLERVNLQDIPGIIEEIKSLAAGFVGCQFQFVKRNCNKLE